MPKCNKPNIVGEILASMKNDGGAIIRDQHVEKAIDMPSKIAFFGRESDNASKNSKYLNSDADKAGFKTNYFRKSSNFIRDPLSIFGEETVRSIINAGNKFKEEANGKDFRTAQKLYSRIVKPVVEIQERKFKTKDEFLQLTANHYFHDMKEGKELFQGAVGFGKAANNAASYYTAFNPQIALFDVFEITTKVPAKAGVDNFVKGVVTTFTKKGLKAFADNSNRALNGIELTGGDKGVAEKLKVLDPQKYSNNLFKNIVEETARHAGVNPSTLLNQTAFLKEIGNVPTYLRYRGAETTWARYGIEAVKFYTSLHTELGNSILRRDPKQFKLALGSLVTYHSAVSVLGGAGTSIPKPIEDILNSNEDVKDYLSELNEDLPFNLGGKTTGLNFKDGLQLSLPKIGLAYASMNGVLQKDLSVMKNFNKTLEDDGAIITIGGILDAMHSTSALAIKHPLLTKTAKNVFMQSAEWLNPDLDDGKNNFLKEQKEE